MTVKISLSVAVSLTKICCFVSCDGNEVYGKQDKGIREQTRAHGPRLPRGDTKAEEVRVAISRLSGSNT